jgi:hypothetical protein
MPTRRMWDPLIQTGQPSSLPTRTWRWFFPASRLGWVCWWLWAGFFVLFVGAFAGDGEYEPGGYFILFGLFWLIFGFVLRWIPIFGHSKQGYDRLPGFMERLQDAKGRGRVLVASSTVVGSAIGMLVGWLA